MKTPNSIARKNIGLDLETTGLNSRKDKIIGVSLAVDDEAFYWDARAEPRILNWLDENLSKADLLIGHNIKFDILFLRAVGVRVPLERARCTMMRAALLNEHLLQYDLDYLAKKYLRKEKKGNQLYAWLASNCGGSPTREAQIRNLDKAPIELVAEYAKVDAMLALELYNWQQIEIDKEIVADCARGGPNFSECIKLEQSLFPHILKMEERGLRVDVEYAERAKERLVTEAAALQLKINKEAGFEFNPNSRTCNQKLFEPRWISSAKAWICTDGTVLEKTKSGGPSMDQSALERMEHPLAAQILALRRLKKTSGTFIDCYVLDRHEHGVVYPSINQTKGQWGGESDIHGTGTGRMSYHSPAMQNIPSRDEIIASAVRPIFLPREGHGWSNGDLEQHEFRVFAHYTNNPSLLKAFTDNPDIDFHQLVANMTGLPRKAAKSRESNAKTLNLAMVFNMGNGSIAHELGFATTIRTITIRGREVVYRVAGDDAMEVINLYHERIPGVRKLSRDAQNTAKKWGHVRTMWGRHIRFPGGQFTHKASGLIFQGTSADLNKLNLLNLFQLFEGRESSLILNIHDDYGLSIAPGEEYLIHEAKRLIEHRPQLRVPIRIDFSIPSPNWRAASIAKNYTGEQK